MTEEFTTINIKPSRSAPLRFRGKQLADVEWDTKDRSGIPDGGWMRFEIWQSQGGSLVAVRVGENAEGHGYTDALVVEPVDPSPTDEEGQPPFAMRDAVLTFFDYHDRARSMARKVLKWSMLRRVA